MSWAVDEADLIEPHRMAPSMLDDIRNQRRKPVAQRRRPTPIEALRALQYESCVILVAAQNLAQGIELREADLDRLAEAARRIRVIQEEVCRWTAA